MNKIICGGFNVGRGLRANGKVLELLGKVPPITDEDEGKVLGVKDGQLAWIEGGASNGALTFIAVEPNSTVKYSKIIEDSAKTEPINISLKYSTNGSTWTDWSYDTPITLANVGDKILVKGNNQDGLNYLSSSTNKTDKNRNQFVLTGKVEATGDVLSLISEDMSVTDLSAKNYCFSSLFRNQTSLTKAPDIGFTSFGAQDCNYMFYGCTSLINTPELFAETLPIECCKFMFSGCSSLTDVSEIHATSCESGCFNSMFSGCTSLVTPPVMHITALSANCYSNMFNGCTSLASVIDLPVTTLAASCYSSMYAGCTSITTPPELPSDKMAKGCYSNMFQGCTSLTTAPALPAITLADSCYSNMFQGCTSLTTAPALPSTKPQYFCYHSMFEDCTSLVNPPPELPATNLRAYGLATSCYEAMFKGCTSLVNAPALPATTLVANCYVSMFEGCTSLVVAPDLPAISGMSNCYQYMFKGCSSLNEITCRLTLSTTYTREWVSGVASTGTFYLRSGLSENRGVNGVPENWTVVNI